MRKQKIMIGNYLNTTRVSIDKIPGLVNYLMHPSMHKAIEEAGKTGANVPIPYDLYEYMDEKFRNFEAKRKGATGGLILFVDHSPYCRLMQRDKIWFHHCPSCNTPTHKLPFTNHKDIFECPECGEMFHVSRQKEEYYI
jgi:predicted RNA-binding Zn-ribbon protein involved in translation (DUF1610 family)